MKLVLYQGETPALPSLFDTPEQAIEWLHIELATKGLRLDHVDTSCDGETGHTALAAFCRNTDGKRIAVEGLQLRPFREYYGYTKKYSSANLDITT